MDIKLGTASWMRQIVFAAMCGTSDEETESNRGSEKHHDSCPVLTLAKRDVCVFYLSNRFYVFLMEKFECSGRGQICQMNFPLNHISRIKQKTEESLSNPRKSFKKLEQNK